MKYRRRPVEIEAMQWNGPQDNEALREFAEQWADIGDFGVSITTPEGAKLVRQGDWVIRGVKGEFYSIQRQFAVCTAEFFDAFYEAVPDAAE